MKVKDIERTANVAWSPKSQYPIYIAAGTAAQQLDASFNTNAALEIYSLNITEPGPDTQQVSSVPSDHRFHKIIWSSHGANQSGTIVGGCDDGLIQIYNAAKLTKGEDGLIGRQQKHSGPVHALDFNCFQENLFATGAGESEIFIWDLNNTSTPMSPGSKCQPLEDVLAVAWNKQVQHILASTFASKCVIWDLRKNEPIIKLTDTVTRIRWKMVAWHPEVATQLCLASEEDHSPIIQLWDLRFATSPLKTLENHQRGVLSVAWCTEDPDLLISCGKDNRIICWNPNSNQANGEVLAEIAKTNQWSFDVQWCPRNPALVACPNYDGHVSIYSIMGGKTQQIQTTNKIADSFPGMEGLTQAPLPQQQVAAPVSVDLSKPPKWLRRPVGASFGFGGKLISFENENTSLPQTQPNVQDGQQPVAVRRTVQISQVITEPELVKQSEELEKALEYGNFTEYCFNKADSTQDQHKKYIWHFLKANFEANPRAEILNLLGYRIEDINAKLNQYVGYELQNNVDGLSDQLANINRLDDLPSEDPFNPISQNIKKPVERFKIKTTDDTDGLITQALLLNNVEAAVELCLKAERYADALIIATTGGPDLLAKTQHKYLEESEGYISSLISAIVSEDWSSIINNCDVSSWKEALAAILTHASDEDLPALCEQLGSRLETESSGNPKLAQDAQLCYICSGNFDRLVGSWSTTAMNSTKDLQELVELVSFLKKSVERQGRNVQISGALADLLSHYASLLASQGNLSTAIAYLGTSQDFKVASLRDRLLTSLGQKSFTQETRQQPLHQQRRHSSIRTTSFSSSGGGFAPSNPFGAVSCGASSNPFGGQQQVTAQQQLPGMAQFNTGLPGVGGGAWQNQPTMPPPVGSFTQPPQVFSPKPEVAPATQPPRPTSVGSAHGGSGLPSRKYVLDPSVTSNQYPSRAPYAPLPSQPTPYQNNINSSPYAPPPVQQQIPSNPVSDQRSPFIPNSTPLIPNAAPSIPNSIYGAPPQQNTEMGQPAESMISASAPPGWNDPPMFNKPLKQVPKSEPQSSEPITHPIFGSAPVQQQPLPVNGYAGNTNNLPPPPLPTQQQPYSAAPLVPPSCQQSYQTTPMAPPNGFQQQQMYQSPPATAFSHANFNQNAVSGGQMAQVQQGEGNVRRGTPQPVEKGPIPVEHADIKAVLEDLRESCSCSANNPQTKRKLEDVARRLENLYDCLREHKLSSNALTSLHQMVELVLNGDYARGLQLHTQLVQGPDFAQIAGFMPGLKVLLQTALQLQVYL